MDMHQLRKWYLERISTELLEVRKGSINIADSSSRISREISEKISEKLGGARSNAGLSGQTLGAQFSKVNMDYLNRAFDLLLPFRQGRWEFRTERKISEFQQYRHLAVIDDIVKSARELQSSIGRDYIVQSDIVVFRYPLTNESVSEVLDMESRVARYTPVLERNHDRHVYPLLHASISCKWTMRSDRSQNTRTEALNLIRNRKGRTPVIVAVTAEPMPTRIASLALGTGDIDCVYHFALPELIDSLKELGNEDQLDILTTMIEGERLRDISDLPFDLII